MRQWYEVVDDGCVDKCGKEKVEPQKARATNLQRIYIYMDVSENIGTPKSSILIGFSIITHPFWGTTIFGNIYIYIAFFEL